jgi:hypothetical protein
VKPMKDDKNKSSLSIEAGAAVNERLGSVLAAGLKEAEPGECLNPEIIAGLVDGTLPVDSEERDEIMKHLSACDSCCEIYLLSAGLQEEEEGKEKGKKDNIIRFRYKSLALAATILIAVVAMYLFFKVDEIPKTPEQLMEMSETKEEDYFRDTAPGAAKKEASGYVEKKGKAADEVKTLKKGGVSAGEGERDERKAEEMMRTAQPGAPRTDLKKKKIAFEAVPAPEPTDSTAAPGKPREREKQEETPADKKADVAGKKERPRGEDEARSPRLKNTGMEAYGPKRKTTQMPRSQSRVSETAATTTVTPPGASAAQVQEVSFDFDLPQLSRMKNRALAYKSHIPGNELTLLFKETAALTKQKDVQEVIEDFRKEAAKTGDSSKLEAFVREMAPMVTVLRDEKAIYVYPNMGYFLSKSVPGSIEYRFFALACTGWCDTDGLCYRVGRTVRGAVPESFFEGKSINEIEVVDAEKQTQKIDQEGRKKRLSQWEALYPGLKGIYKEIASSTITHLKKPVTDGF